MKKLTTMREALNSPDVFAPLVGGPSWAPWRALLIAIVGEALTPGEREIFRTLTGREIEPGEPVDEFWGVVGRRGGKSRAISILAAYVAALVDHRGVLAPGERGVLPILAASTDQAGAVFNFTTGIFDTVPHLGALVTGRNADTLSLKTGVDIRVRPASFRTIRSITAVAAICDELAFWRSDESVNPDEEILAALRPSLLTSRGPLFCISSPHAKKGELWKSYRENFGPNGDPRILVANAPSRVMNEMLPAKDVERAYARDAARARAEYGAQFRDDIEDFLSVADLDKVVSPGLGEIPPASGTSYFGFCDPSGGKADSMTLAIAHQEGETVVLDLVVEKVPPLSPDAVTAEFAEILKAYRLSEVTGDRYGAAWVTERFQKNGITYKASDRSRSEIYQATLPLIMEGNIRLLDQKKMLSQFAALERRVNKGGKDSINHPTGGNDDVCNAVAGAIVGAHGSKPMEWGESALEGLSIITGGMMSDFQLMQSKYWRN